MRSHNRRPAAARPTTGCAPSANCGESDPQRSRSRKRKKHVWRCYNPGMSNRDEPEKLDSIPLFPLPNVVLFPRAILPLHIFEERYKVMTADVLCGDRQIAMALLRPGWEKSYYSSPAVEPVVCVGRIVSHERLPDGKYNFLLQGVARARIVREISRDLPYRVAKLQALEETKVLEIDLSAARQRLEAIFSNSGFAAMGIARQFRQMLSRA